MLGSSYLRNKHFTTLSHLPSPFLRNFKRHQIAKLTLAWGIKELEELACYLVIPLLARPGLEIEPWPEIFTGAFSPFPEAAGLEASGRRQKSMAFLKKKSIREGRGKVSGVKIEVTDEAEHLDCEDLPQRCCAGVPPAQLSVEELFCRRPRLAPPGAFAPQLHLLPGLEGQRWLQGEEVEGIQEA